MCRGAPAGARVAFLRKKLRKNLFGKGFLVANGDGANIGRPFLRGRAQYLPKAKTVCGLRFFGWAHFSLGGIRTEYLERFSNWDLSVSVSPHLFAGAKWDMGPTSAGASLVDNKTT